MAYVDQGGPADRTAAIAGVAIIHAAIGTLLVVGLSTQVKQIFVEPPPDTFDVPTSTPTPPPDPKPDTKSDQAMQRDHKIIVPDPIFDLSTDAPPVETSDDLKKSNDDILKDLLPPAGTGIGDGLGLGPSPVPTFSPVAAQPSNDTSRWVTTNDYRQSWINRGMEGTARFSVTVDTNGRVTECRIVSSTGHTALDRATCNLVKSRARFEPALNADQVRVTDTYTKSVRWQVPE